MPFGEVVGGPQSCLSFDMLLEIQTGNNFDLSDSVLRDIGAQRGGIVAKHAHLFLKNQS